jgi:hypothetical protein
MQQITPKTVLPSTAKLLKPAIASTEGARQADFIANSLNRQGGIDAVQRILKYGKTETGRDLDDYPWFRDQIRLTADFRLKEVLTTGASQVSKSLVNYLVAIDCLVSGQINLGWFYASRQSMINQQPEQFQKMIGYWLDAIEERKQVGRESTTRYSVGNAVANFSYANSSDESKAGGAAEGKEQASFSASILFLEERSSWKQNVDVTPRLGASLLPSKPKRQLGTPGSSSGIEREIRDASHLFAPATHCQSCGSLTFLDPKGALLKSAEDERSGKQRWFNARGEILDYWSKDGTPQGAYVACTHCGAEIDADAIAKCRLWCKKNKVSAEDFLDLLQDGEIYPHPVAIYLSPLLRVPSDPYRAVELVKEGLEPQNPSIYQQNKLGHQSSLDANGITLEDYQRVLELPAAIWGDTIRVCGIDQGRDTHWMVILEFKPNSDRHEQNIILADAVPHDEILPTLERFDIFSGFIDNEPDRLSAYDLSRDSGLNKDFHHPLATDGYKNRLMLVDQKTFEGDFKPIVVSHGGKELPCYAINHNVFKDEIVANFGENPVYRIAGKVHRKFEKHLTSVRRNPDSGIWERPADHDDDLFFALMFADAARALVMKGLINKPKPKRSPSVGKPLKNPFG